MNPDTVSKWLLNPQLKPAPETIAQFVTTWPWFAPGRLMELCRQDAGEPLVLDRLRIYAPEWLCAYIAVTAPEKIPAAAPKALFDISAGQRSDAAPVQFPTFSLVQDEEPAEETPSKEPQIPIQPLFSEDYFKSQGLDTDSIATILPEQVKEAGDPRTLMIMMSFSEWLNHFKRKREKEDEEVREQRALKSMWQREKLAAALEDEPDEIPEQVFEMAVSSISREDGLVSESLAEVLEKQEKWAQAAEMYRKLGLRNPAKSTYFATRAEAAKKHIS
jgi:hypothetical protein